MTQGTGGWEFSSFEFDNPPDLYPTVFRTYYPEFGRWLTPDPLGGDVTNPQSLNRYAYVLNNPTTLTDPSGLCPAVTVTGICGPVAPYGFDNSQFSGWTGAWGVESCGVDPFCIENGGIGPFGSPVAQGGSYLTATYEAGGWYYVPEAVAAEEARWQRIFADFAAKRQAADEKRQQQALLQCIASGVCNFSGQRRPYNEGFTFLPTNGGGLRALLNNGPFTENYYTGLLHESVTGAGTTDYRSFNGEFGSGSLQVDVGSGGVYFDVDRFNPDQSFFSFMGHTFLEVIPHFFRGY